MIRVCFICLGNICRSTMAEFLFKKMVKDKNIQDSFLIESRATSDEAVGMHVYEGTRKVLDRFNIDYSKKAATQLKKSDSEKFDLFVCMDNSNIRNTNRILAGTDAKICKLLDFTPDTRDVADPYYTRDFEATYRDIMFGLEHMIKEIL